MRKLANYRALSLLTALLVLAFGVAFTIAAFGMSDEKTKGKSRDAGAARAGQPASRQKAAGKAATRPTTPRDPKVNVPKDEAKPSEGDTAGAIRGRPATGGDGEPAAAASDDPWQLLMDMNRRFAALERRVQSMEAELAARAGASADPGAAADATTPGAGDVETAPTEDPAADTTQPDSDDASGGAVTIVPNPELKGRLGRVVVSAPDGTKNRSSISLYNAGEEKGTAADSGYGTLTSETLAGSYTVVLHNVQLPVEVRRGHDTVVKLGVLRINASKQTAWSLLLKDGERGTSGYGGEEVGVLPGDYVVKIKNSSEAVTVEPGKVLEF